jgi:hypothetical protein
MYEHSVWLLIEFVTLNGFFLRDLDGMCENLILKHTYYEHLV